MSREKGGETEGQVGTFLTGTFSRISDGMRDLPTIFLGVVYSLKAGPCLEKGVVQMLFLSRLPLAAIKKKSEEVKKPNVPGTSKTCCYVLCDYGSEFFRENSLPRPRREKIPCGILL